MRRCCSRRSTRSGAGNVARRNCRADRPGLPRRCCRGTPPAAAHRRGRQAVRCRGSPGRTRTCGRPKLSAPPADIPSLLRPEEPASVQSLDLAGGAVRIAARRTGRAAGPAEPALVVADGETVAGPGARGGRPAGAGLQRRRPPHRAGGNRRDSRRPGTQRLGTPQPARNAQTAAATDATAAEPQRRARPVLAVVGSASGTAQAQLAQLEGRRLHAWSGCTRSTRAPPVPTLPQLAQASAGPGGRQPAWPSRWRPQKWTRPARPASSRRCPAFAAEAAQGDTHADLILTGGETAREVLDAVGLQPLVPLAAVQHGAVLSRADDGTLVGTKPGSFGDDLALLQLYDANPGAPRPVRRPLPPTPFPARLPNNLEQT